MTGEEPLLRARTSGSLTLLLQVASGEVGDGDPEWERRDDQRGDENAFLQRLLTDAGFSIVRLTYTNAALFLPMLA